MSICGICGASTGGYVPCCNNCAGLPSDRIKIEKVITPIEKAKNREKILQEDSKRLADALIFLLDALETFEKHYECALPNNAISNAEKALDLHEGLEL